MAASVRLFEKTAAGLLIEIDPAEADKRREGRRVSAVNLVVHVLFTDDEEKAHDDELARLTQQTKQVQKQTVDNNKRREEIAARVGLSVEEMRILLG